MLNLVRMSGFAKSYPAQLSGGERLRVARALIGGSRLLLLDEPLSSLDADLRGELRDELLAIQKRLGITTVSVTHDEAEARIGALYSLTSTSTFKENLMKLHFFAFALIVLSISFGVDARAQSSLEDNADYREFRKWVVASQEPNPLDIIYKWCIESYDKMIANGVSPSTRVIEDKDWGLFWKGTVQEIKENLCESGRKKLSGDLEAKHAPYKTHLKADKLRLVINEKSGHVYSYALAGGKYTDDAKALAAARVWFRDIGAPSNETQYCLNGGKRSSVRRYTFDVSHKLLSTTEKAYCGTPPASAYR